MTAEQVEGRRFGVEPGYAKALTGAGRRLLLLLLQLLIFLLREGFARREAEWLLPSLYRSGVELEGEDAVRYDEVVESS